MRRSEVRSGRISRYGGTTLLYEAVLEEDEAQVGSGPTVSGRA